MEYPRVLIVGTVPYNTRSTSRALDSYFHNWPSIRLAQVFSDAVTPVKGHCGTLYQITDYRLLRKWKGDKEDVGVIFNYDELPDSNESSERVDEKGKVSSAYRWGSKHTPLSHLLRGLLWRESFWKTPQFEDWLDSFKPECVFMCSSDDYFIPRIATYVSQKYNIPIVPSISDDYLFDYHFSLNPLYHFYKLTYRATMKEVFKRCAGGAVYISDTIRDKYNKEYGLEGETVFLTSSIKRKQFTPVKKENPVITYFGNISLGRNLSLDRIGKALGEINHNYRLLVYSSETHEEICGVLKNNPNICYNGTIPYEEVQRKLEESDITIVVEGFRAEDIRATRYSLSTKVADCLSSGTCVLAYGSKECGAIDYLIKSNAAFVCTDSNGIVGCIKEILNSVEKQEQCYYNQISVIEKKHTIENSCVVAKTMIEKSIQKMCI